MSFTKPKKLANPVDLDPIHEGLPRDLKKDLYFNFVTSSWPMIFLVFFLFYIVSNLIFAALYMFSSGSISGAMEGSFLDAFFFSAQTMSTIGYGGLSPSGVYSNFLVVIESAVGVIMIATFTGLIFAKLSKPHAKVLFSKNLLRSLDNDAEVLTFRMGNARGNDIMEAKVSVSALFDVVSLEGQNIRKIEDLKLRRSKSPFFRMTWSIFHEIDEDSPIRKYKEEDLRGILVTMTGHDGTYSDTIYSRHLYDPADIIRGKYFVDIMHDLPDGRMMIDYNKFHELK